MVFASKKSVDIAVSQINDDLEAIADWSTNNGLIINPTKSVFIILGTKNQKEKLRALEVSLKISGSPISEEAQVKNLGFVMDDTLRFETHLNAKMAKCFGGLKSRTN